MIKIKVTRNKGNMITKCTIDGHAGYDTRGFDIVCAAVSGISCTAIIGLQRVTNTIGIYETKPGYCMIRPKETTDEKGQIILEMMVAGLTEISCQFPLFVKFNKTIDK